MVKGIPDDITNVDKLDPTRSIGGSQDEGKMPGKSFSDYMDDSGKVGGTEKAPGEPSPIELAQQNSNQAQLGTPSHESVQAQMESASSVLGDIQNQLHTKNLKLKPSQKYLLRNKLSESNAMIRSAAQKAGAEVGPMPTGMSKKNPIAKFLAMAADSQTQLQGARKSIASLNKQGGKIDSGKLLMVQVKLAKAQQELEYTSVLLSQAVGDVKTLFNIQI
ncbi:MAG: hypothetical protein SP1CHLAM54_17470 [Chlamydiia bacterium]|nr:hypothetical protein [Chlamydiia bacterium]MCH9616635.1 hypothetical protein [Chlamydiia bacterium]MCH9629366.1 hypothetical protein [Chlamydiia bacterium]